MAQNIFAELITIGDEILFGQITDTNSQWMSQELDKIGIRVRRKSSVGDQREEILRVLQEAEERANVILITGGLGPTKDDITKKTLADYFNTKLVVNEQALKEVTQFFESRGRELSETNRSQGYLPENCIPITNTLGTAPGMWFERNGKVFVSMPGVPFEMKEMMSKSILPSLKKYFQTPVIFHKNIRTSGIGESYLSDSIQEWELALPSHIKLAYLPSLDGVKLRLTATGNSLPELEKEVNTQAQKLSALIGPFIHSYDDQNLEISVARLLSAQHKTLAVAESCTGGYVSHLVTSVPGSSSFFYGGVIAYDNSVKLQQLQVKEETLKNYGAVSEQTAGEMAEGIRKKLGTSIGISTTGIAGPDGGTEEKPVGTVWIALSDGSQIITKKLQWGKSRDINIKLSSYAVLNLLRQSLETNLG